MYHNATPFESRLRLWNESGTNRARISDSIFPGCVHRNIWSQIRFEITRSRLNSFNKCAENTPTVKAEVESKRGQSQAENRNQALAFAQSRGRPIYCVIIAFWRPAAASPW